MNTSEYPGTLMSSSIICIIEGTVEPGENERLPGWQRAETGRRVSSYPRQTCPPLHGCPLSSGSSLQPVSLVTRRCWISFCTSFKYSAQDNTMFDSRHLIRTYQILFFFSFVSNYVSIINTNYGLMALFLVNKQEPTTAIHIHPVLPPLSRTAAMSHPTKGDGSV